jgi:hypothetical protein
VAAPIPLLAPAIRATRSRIGRSSMRSPLVPPPTLDI